jgi:hypothetical protein
MVNAADWFSVAVPDSEARTSAQSASNWPFSMDLDEDVRIAFLNADDDDIPPIHYHNVMNADGKLRRVLCTASEHLGGYCHMCEYTAAQPQSEQWKTMLRPEFCYTILDYRPESGKPMEKKIRLSTKNDNKLLMSLKKSAVEKMGKDALQLNWIELSRPSTEDKPAKIGKFGQILGEVDVESFNESHEEGFLNPFTFEEILVQFVQDEQEREDIYKLYPINSSKSTSSGTIKEIE